MATNDRKDPDAATNSESGRPVPAPGSNDSSHTFTDMPQSGKSPEDDGKVDISSADDVDVDKDTPVDDEDVPKTPPDPVRDGG